MTAACTRCAVAGGSQSVASAALMAPSFDRAAARVHPWLPVAATLHPVAHPGARRHISSSRPAQGITSAAKSLWASLFHRGAPVDYDQRIADAHAALLSVKKSDNVLVNIHTTLQKPLAELSRLEFQELRKLAHHAYYGIGACVRGGACIFGEWSLRSCPRMPPCATLPQPSRLTLM